MGILCTYTDKKVKNGYNFKDDTSFNKNLLLLVMTLSIAECVHMIMFYSLEINTNIPQ
jgi:hypothetical protein